MKKSFFLVVLLTSLLFSVFQGCSRHGGSALLDIEKDGSIYFSFSMSPPGAMAKKLAVTDSSDLKEIVILLKGPNGELLVDSNTLSGGLSAVFEKEYLDIASGTWTIRAKILSIRQEVVHDSSQVVFVDPGEEASVIWNLNSKKSEFELTIDTVSFPSNVKFAKMYIDGILIDSIDLSKDLFFKCYLDIGVKYLVKVTFFNENKAKIGESRGELEPSAKEPTNGTWETVWEDGSVKIKFTLGAPSRSNFSITMPQK